MNRGLYNTANLPSVALGTARGFIAMGKMEGEPGGHVCIPRTGGSQVVVAWVDGTGDAGWACGGVVMDVLGGPTSLSASSKTT